MSYTENEKTREKIDGLLHELAVIESNLGTDSTKKEYAKAKTKQQRILNKIKKLDEEFYKTIVPADERE